MVSQEVGWRRLGAYLGVAIDLWVVDGRGERWEERTVVVAVGRKKHDWHVVSTFGWARATGPRGWDIIL